MLVCAFQEMGCLLVSLGTTASSILLDSQSGPVTTAFAVLVHPCQAARLAAAWCLRCVCFAAPSQTTPVIDKYLDLMNFRCFAKMLLQVFGESGEHARLTRSHCRLQLRLGCSFGKCPYVIIGSSSHQRQSKSLFEI